MRLRPRIAWVLCLAGGLVACDDNTASGEGVEAVGVVRTIEPAELAEVADHVLDSRSTDAFASGHVEGACPISAAALRAAVDGVDGQVAPREDAWQAFAAAGLHPDDTVVVTADDNGTDPARIAWTLRYYGHRGDVVLLDGGMRAYAEQGLPVASGTGPAPGAYEAGETREELRVDKAWMLAHLDDASVQVFDVRSAGEYAAGHIPGARNVDWSTNKNADGSFRSSTDVRALHGEPEASTLVVYCQTGSRAAVSWALLQRAGYEDVRLYDGSWSEWSADPDTPRE